MRVVSKIALGAAAALALSGGAMATDFGIPGPDTMMTDWSGGYVGVTGSYYYPAVIGEVAGVVGFNFMPAESFLIGIEGRAGYYFLSSTGIDVSLSVRAGVVAGQALIYATAGEWYNVTTGGALYPFVGGGVEFMATDDLSVRLQGVYYLTSGNSEVSAGLLWHFH